MQDLALRSGRFDVFCSEDLSLISADSLQNFDILYFFASGELELSDQQKADLLAFVRDGKGFGGVHSATDTLYTWPEYGELIGAYFNGHPWAQDVSINVEDSADPIASALAPSFRIAWRRDYGQGRVFYTALGHGVETWLDERFQNMLLNALIWLGGASETPSGPGGLQGGAGFDPARGFCNPRRLATIANRRAGLGINCVCQAGHARLLPA